MDKGSTIELYSSFFAESLKGQNLEFANRDSVLAKQFYLNHKLQIRNLIANLQLAANISP